VLGEAADGSETTAKALLKTTLSGPRHNRKTTTGPEGRDSFSMLYAALEAPLFHV